MVGVSKPSGPSEAFLCEKWTMAEPGESHKLTFTLLQLKERLTNETEDSSSTELL